MGEAGGFFARYKRAAESHHGRPETIECKGCGRKIPIDGLELWQKFICKRCMRTMRLTAPLFRFHYTRGVAIRKRLYTALFVVLLTGFSAAWGWQQVGFVGHPLFVYAMTAGVAAVVSLAVAVAREFTQDYRLIGGFALPVLATRRFAIGWFAADWGHPYPMRVWLPGFLMLGFGLYFLWLVRRRRRTLSIR